MSGLTGSFGEAAAAEYLRKKGYEIVGMNYRTRMGELDVIARNRKYLCFVEVKLRSNLKFGLPREFVTASKQEKLRTTAQFYMSTHRLDVPARFDVAEVYTDKEHTSVRIEYIEEAF